LSSRVRVLLVDDEALVRAGLRMILGAAEDLEVVGEAGDGVEAVEQAHRLAPDVVLMDIRMPRKDGLAATRELRRLPAPPRVVILTTFDADEHVFEALQSGADGFLLKDTPPRSLVAAVRTVQAGTSILSPGITARLARAQRPQVAPGLASRVAALSDRERDVLRLVAQGASNAEIGRELFLSEATVKAHVTRILDRLGCDNRVQAAIAAHRAGLTDGA
jgi:DNA-binding NarL/FixJ family response regulator